MKHSLKAQRRLLALIAGARAVAILAVAGLLAPPLRPASASHPELVWTSVAAACPVDDVDLSLYNATGTGIAFSGTATGDILARCNVEPFADAGALEVSYKDPDGSGTTCIVVAKLQRVTNTGSLVTVATFDSNSFPASDAVETNFISFAHDFNFFTGAYYVSLRVTRTTSTVDCFGNIVRLTTVIP